MDKLRALQYFIAAAEEGSFSGASRRLDVSVPSITKLVGSLERQIGVRLVDRSPRGLVLTAKGSRYLEACQPLVQRLAEADRDASNKRPAQRTVVLGAPGLLSRLHLVPALSRFRQRHPHIHIDLRAVDQLTVTEAATRGIDVLVALGWPGDVSLVQRPLAQSRLIVCATPEYWARHGTPAHPRELTNHECLLVRSPEGTVLDFWRCVRGEEREEVAVKGWFLSESRDYVLAAVLNGMGVSRFADVSIWPHLECGALRPVLLDWDSSDAPPFSALYRPEAKKDASVQALVAFLADLMADLEAKCNSAIGARPTTSKPTWYSTRRGRASRGSTSRI